MQSISFPGNTRDCNFEYIRVREGPNYFVSYYKNTSMMHSDPKECWRVLGVAKFTDSGKALKEWAEEIYENNLPKPELDKSRLLAEGFGPEAHSDNPTEHTRMIT